MKTIRLRAVVLVAGHGRRLQPLTAFLPKALLPIRGKPAVARTLEILARVGCEAVALNLFHMGEAIRAQLGDTFAGIPLTYSHEQELLGTLGALGPLRDFLSPAELVLVVNGDSLCRWPVRQMLRRHRRSRADATLLVSKSADPAPFGGGVGLDKRKRIVSLRTGNDHAEEARRRVFMGAHVLAAHVLERVPEGYADFVNDLYEPMIAEGFRIAAVESARKWHDLGTPERYRRGVLDWGWRRAWVSPDAKVSASARVHRAIVEGRARVEQQARVFESVVLPEARVGRKCRVVESIIGPGVHLPEHTAVERRMVTVLRADATASEAASVVGGLVYEPM